MDAQVKDTDKNMVAKNPDENAHEVTDGKGTRKQLEVFTDGSCDTVSRRGGWAYLLRYGEQQKTASGFEADTTNNRMELTAAVAALSALKEPCRVTLMTDSQYLKNAFTAGWLKNWQRNGWKTAGKQPVKNKDLWLRLLELSAVHELQWAWTKGHTGHPENELVDRLALQARRRGGA
jgi:ribonuclease HI